MPDEHALQHPERAGQHVLGYGALQQRQRGDVDQRVADADSGEGDDRAQLGRPAGDQHDRQPPEQHSRRERGRQPRPAGQRQHDGRAGQPADADHRVQRADAALPHARSGRARSRRSARRAHRRPASAAPYSPTSSVIGRRMPMARNPAVTSPAIDSGSVRGRASRAGSSMRHTIAADHAKAAAVKANAERRPADGDQHAADRRPGERPDALDRARGRVGRGQLVGRPRQAREHRRLGRGERRGEHPADADQPVGKGGRPVGGRDQRDDGHQPDADEIGRQHHLTARAAVADHGDERCCERRRQHPAEHRDADRRRAARVEREDRERDGVPPRSGERPDGGQFQAAEPWIGEDRPERPDRTPSGGNRCNSHPAWEDTGHASSLVM